MDTNQLSLSEASDTDVLLGRLMVKRGIAKTSSCTKVPEKLPVANETEHTITIPRGTAVAHIYLAATVAYAAQRLYPYLTQRSGTLETPQFLQRGKRD